ncbi:M23 family metallopeptidase [Dermabacter sp. HMSC08H10]|uniref:M23 family metallopeptidase n=1 Tax=Dermabacter sp. HMSC08H10 TaxID=1581144 RepID=UPI0008A357AE|nr:M23 family metallopeptidase [Dermabacter sp. HMSC08H10]OFT20593.1 hypothetical protein HMPREF3176_06230 [Dermabacter sp. HMSC08H10]
MHLSTRLGTRIIVIFALLIGTGFFTLTPAHGEGDENLSHERLIAIMDHARRAVRTLVTPTSPKPPPAQDPSGREGIWAWPLGPEHDVVRFFEAPAHRYGPGHRGIDIAGSTLEVSAVDSGTVTFAGKVAGKPVVAILHGNGLTSTYEPVIASIAKGDSVHKGQAIGVIEQPSEHAHCDAGCVHLGAKRGKDYLDPLPLLEGRGPSVLLPRQ